MAGEGETLSCEGLDMVIASFPLRGACRNARLRIDRFDLWRQGAHAIQVEEGGMVMTTARGAQGLRPWVVEPRPRAHPGESPARASSKTDGLILSGNRGMRLTMRNIAASNLTMSDIRKEIDRIDESLIKLLAERQRCVEKAIQVKKRDGLPARDPARIAQVIDHVRVLAPRPQGRPRPGRAMWTEMVEWFVALRRTLDLTLDRVGRNA